jgi:hypothetical protein
MRVLGVLFLVFILSLLSTVRAGDQTPSPVLSACPLPAEGETALDCPWAAIARDLGAAPPAKVSETMDRIAPDYAKRIEREGRIAHNVKKLWGTSINFDENAKGIIIAEPIIDAVLAKAKVPPRDGRHVFAGFEHTYGYLLSNLKTPYGYKRLRWVRPDIELGFGLETGSISPTPKSGGLFMNISTFAGTIAFRGHNGPEMAALKILRKTSGAARAIRNFDYASLHGRRLTETLAFEGGRTLEIRTDFVPFTKNTGADTGGNSELLIYSMKDSSLPLPYLISAFPIAPGFSDGALAAAGLGEGKPIVTKYNAFVPGVTDMKAALTGKREASAF